jgi:single-strand DNA-binding protein
MDVSTVTVLGNVAAEPRISNGIDEVERVNFRVIASQRRLDRQTNTWVEAGEYSVNVVCWRALARGVAGSIHLGDPVLVVGRIAERQYEVEGAKRYATEVTATYVGHDLSKGRATFKRFPRSGAAAGAPAGADGAEGATDAAQPIDAGNVDAEVPVPFEVPAPENQLAAV